MQTRWAGKAEAIGFSIYALVLGFFGFTLMFTALPIENAFLRLGLLVAFYFAIAVPIGYFDHRFWPIAGLLAWNSVIVGVFGLGLDFRGRTWGELFMIVLVFAVPLASALAGGYAGALWWRRNHPGPEEPEDAE